MRAASSRAAERLDQIVVGAGGSRPSTLASSPARADSMITGRRPQRSLCRAAACSKPKPSSFGIITSVSTRSGATLSSAVQRRLAVRDRLDFVSASRAGAADSSRMSALSSATGHAHAPFQRRRRRRSAQSSRRRGARPAASAGPPRRRPSARIAVRRERARRSDAVAEGDAVPCGSATVKVVPRPTSRFRSSPCRRAASPAPAPARGRCPCLRACVPACSSTRWKRSNSCGSSVRRDADAGVAHRAARTARSSRRQTHRDRALERELERVGEQVQDDLLPHVPVDVDRLAQRRAVDDRARARALHRRAEGARQIGGERAEVDRLVARLARGRPRCARSRAAC